MHTVCQHNVGQAARASHLSQGRCVSKQLWRFLRSLWSIVMGIHIHTAWIQAPGPEMLPPPEPRLHSLDGIA